MPRVESGSGRRGIALFDVLNKRILALGGLKFDRTQNSTSIVRTVQAVDLVHALVNLRAKAAHIQNRQTLWGLDLNDPKTCVT
jgi:hypothetical protein